MQYKLKNKSTNEEVLCIKVVVEGFDYYVSDEKIKLDEYYIDDTNAIRQTITECETYWTTRKSYKKLIATNNSSIDIPKVIDERHILNIKSLTDFENKKPENYALNGSNFYEGFKEGYNTHAETHTLSDDEVVEFMEWYKSNSVQIYNRETKLHQISLKPNSQINTKELLQLFKEQQIKTLIYE